MIALALAGCTFAPGVGFSTLSRVDVEGALLPEGPVTVDEARWGLGTVALEALSGGGGAFDPANPPEGYGLCHNGHCHAADGSLPSYAEIEASLAGDAATWEAVAWVEPGELVAGGETVRLREVEPSELLPASEVGRLSVELASLDATGEVDGLPFELSAALDEVATGSLSLSVDRDAPAEVTVHAVVALSPDWLEGVDLVTTDPDGVVRVTEEDLAPLADHVTIDVELREVP